MEIVFLVGFFAFIGGMLLQKAIPTAKQPQFICIQAEAKDLMAERNRPAGCLPLFVVGLILVTVLWFI